MLQYDYVAIQDAQLKHHMLDITPHSSLGLQTDNELHPQRPRSACSAGIARLVTPDLTSPESGPSSGYCMLVPVKCIDSHNSHTTLHNV